MKHWRRTFIILSLSTITLIAGILYYISIQQAETLIQSIVQKQSDGKLDLRIKKISLDFSNLSFVVKRAEFNTINSPADTTGYHVKVNELRFNVKNLYSVITKGHFIIDTILIDNPQIDVIKFHRKNNTEISLPNEIKTVYEWLESTVSLVNLNHLNISHASIRITDKTTPKPRTVSVKNMSLIVNDISQKKNDKTRKFMFARNIIFEISGQNILFPDGKHGLAFRKFRIETRKHHLLLDSCTIYANENQSNTGSYHVFSDSVLIKDLNPDMLATKNTLQFDSALCYRPVINMKIKNNGVKKNISTEKVNTDSVLNRFSNLFGKVNMGFVAVKDAKIKVSIEKNHKTSVYKSEKSTFSLGGIVIDPDNENPLQIQSIRLNVAKYTGYLPDSLYIMKFDKISIENNKILLHNFDVKPTPQNNEKIRRSFSIKVFELEDIDWMALIFDQQLKARYASLIDPYIEIISEADNFQPKRKINPIRLLSKIKQKIQVNEWYIKKGDIRFVKKSGAEIRLSEAFMNIDVKKLMSAENEIKLIDAIDSLWFYKGSYLDSKQTISLSGGNYSSHSSTFRLNNIDYKTATNEHALQLSGLTLEGITLQSKQLYFRKATWQRAIANFALNTTTKSTSRTPLHEYGCTIKQIDGENTRLQFTDNKGSGSFTVDRLTANDIDWKPGKTPAIGRFNLSGHDLAYKGSRISINAGQIQIANAKESVLKDIQCNIQANYTSVRMNIPLINFRFTASDLLDGKPNIDQITVFDPGISYKKQITLPDEGINSKFRGTLPEFELKSISIINPKVVDQESSDSFTSTDGKVLLREISSNGTVLKINTASLELYNPEISHQGKLLSGSNDGLIKASFRNISAEPGMHKFEITTDTIQVKNVLMSDKTARKLFIGNFASSQVRYNNSMKTALDIVKQNPDLRFNNTTIRIIDKNNILDLKTVYFTNKGGYLTADSIKFTPAADSETYMQLQKWQKTYNQISAGNCTVSGIQLADILERKQVHLHKITVNGLLYFAYKDKRLPLKHGVIKPLPTEIFMNMNTDLKIDTIAFRNSKVIYREYVPATKSVGEITLQNLNGTVSNIRSKNINSNDSLRLTVSGKIENASSLKVNYKQSYADTLSTFYLKVILGRMDMKKLNPVLRSFASAELRGGKLDTLRMSSIGRRYIAVGSMKMYYSGLNIKYNDNVREQKTTFLGKAVSFVANLLLNSYNITGANHVYAERDPELGFANYWVKILLSGAMTNAGISTDKQYERKYKRALKTHDVPPIANIPEDF